MKCTIIALAGLYALAASPALAGAAVKFAPYEGTASVVQGEGGTRTTKNGIDYWDTGTPPRKYQVLGVITDKRYEGWGEVARLAAPKSQGK